MSVSVTQVLEPALAADRMAVKQPVQVARLVHELLVKADDHVAASQSSGICRRLRARIGNDEGACSLAPLASLEGREGPQDRRCQQRRSGYFAGSRGTTSS